MSDDDQRISWQDVELPIDWSSDEDLAPPRETELLQKLGAKGRSFSQNQFVDWNALFDVDSDEDIWLRKLKKKECTRYKPLSSTDSTCWCGRPKAAHPPDLDELDNSTNWKRETCISASQTDVICKLQFKRDPNSSMVLRVQNDIVYNDLHHLLNKILHMVLHNVYIHFVDFEEFEDNLDDNAAEVLRNGLQEGLKTLSQKSRLAIISMGLQKSVSRHIHQVLAELCKDEHFHTEVFRLACVPWGILHEEDVSPLKSEGISALKVLKPDAETRYEGSVLGEKLSPFFSHYILFDDGQIGKRTDRCTEVTFRKRVDKVLREMNKNAVKVYVLMNGGPRVLDYVLDVIKKEVPVIIIKGSGGYADRLSENYLKCERITKREMTKTGKFVHRSHLRLQPNLVNVDDDVKDKVRSILKENHLLTVYDPTHRTQGLDMVICQALLKGRQEDQLSHLLESFLDKDKFLGSSSVQMDFLIEAMLNDSPDIVAKIVKGTLCLHKHFTIYRLSQLYDREQSLGSCAQELDAANKKNAAILGVKRHMFGAPDVRKVLKNLLHTHYPLVCKGKRCQCVVKGEEVADMELYHEQDYHTCLEPMQEMFLWALLTNHQSQAKMFWNYCEDKMAAALVAKKLLNSLAEKEQNCDADKELKLRENANEFGALAVNVLRVCHEVDKPLTFELLMKSSTWWGNYSVIELAHGFESRTFISQPSCMALLNKIWKRDLTVTEPWLTVLTVLTIPLLILLSPAFSYWADEYEGFTLKKGDRKTCWGTVKAYFTTPVVKYHLNVISLVLFLALFAYVLLAELHPTFSALEGVLCLWVFTYFVEEFRQLMSVKETQLYSRCKVYLQQDWNKLDIFSVLVFLVGMILAAFQSQATYDARRVLLGIDFVLFCMRLLQAFAVGSEMGIMLTMIRKMVTDTKNFMIILLVFILSYAVASESILFPEAIPSGQMIYNVPRKAYWQIYGEFFLEEVEGTNGECSDVAQYNSSVGSPHCPSSVGRIAVPILLALYCIVTHVLLLNLLIAKFNDTYSEVKADAKIHWAWFRCQIIYEYSNRPCLPPPLNIFSCLIWIVLQIFRFFMKLFGRGGQLCCRHSAGQNLLSGAKILQKRSNSITISWKSPKDSNGVRQEVYRYKLLCYVIEDTVAGIQDVNKPNSTVLLYSVKHCTVTMLKPYTMYEILIKFQCGLRGDWIDHDKIRVRTAPEASEISKILQHETECAEQLDLLETPDEVYAKLDDVTESLSKDQQHLSDTLQETTSHLTQLEKKVELLSKDTNDSLQKNFDTISADLVTKHGDVKSAIARGWAEQSKNMSSSINELKSTSEKVNSELLDKMKTLQAELSREKTARSAMSAQIEALQGHMTNQTALMENLLKTLSERS